MFEINKNVFISDYLQPYNSVARVRERTIPTDRQSLVTKASAVFWW
jgi:hypothetical protein